MGTFHAVSQKDPLVGLWKNTQWPVIWGTDVVKEALWVFMLSKSSSETPLHDEPNDLSSKCFRERTFHCQHEIPISFLPKSWFPI